MVYRSNVEPMASGMRPRAPSAADDAVSIHDAGHPAAASPAVARSPTLGGVDVIVGGEGFVSLAERGLL